MSVFESEECGDGMVGVFHETVETVLRLRPAQNTPLKQGVNDKMEHDKTINQVP